MISKSRLEELIEQGAKIFYFDAYEDNDWGIVELDTKNFSFSHNENCYINFCEETWRTNPQPYKMWEDDLFETKEEAEWYREFGCIERTERLELPTWEEIEPLKDLAMHEFITKDGLQSELVVDVFENKISIIGIGGAYDIWDLTKENYTLACRKCKELFLGEKE